MPQISQILATYASQFFWLLIVFGLIYFVIGRGILPRVDATVDARDAKIAGDLAAAEKARAEASDLEGAWQAELTQTHAAAQAEAQKAKAKAQKDADTRIAKADAEIAAKTADAEAVIAKARAKALSGIDGVAADAAQDIVAKVSGIKVTPAQAAQAVKTVLANG
jgi:F-type H+-transporting ATPase subunit b